MFQNFSEIESYILKEGIKKRLVLCGAQDDSALKAVVAAKRKGVVSGILIGDESKICGLLEEMGEPQEYYEIVHEINEMRAAKLAVKYIQENHADIQMKGSMQSSTYLMPILNPMTGLVPQGNILNETTVFYYPDRNGLIFCADCAYNIAPTLEDKVKIIKNVAKLAKAFGQSKVKVAAVSILETVNPQISSTVEAEQLSKMEWGDDIIVEGPFALDNALSEEAAKHKGIAGEVAGHADILLMPEICSGNALHKCIHFLANLPSASILSGATAPVVFTSRTDSMETKYYSILTAILETL